MNITISEVAELARGAAEVEEDRANAAVSPSRMSTSISFVPPSSLTNLGPHHPSPLAIDDAHIPPDNLEPQLHTPYLSFAAQGPPDTATRPNPQSGDPPRTDALSGQAFDAYELHPLHGDPDSSTAGPGDLDTLWESFIVSGWLEEGVSEPGCSGSS